MVTIVTKKNLIRALVPLFIKMFIIGWVAGLALAGEQAQEGKKPIPTPGLVTMLNFGARGCVPCKMMAPIIEELKKEYNGSVSIIYINSFRNREQAKRWGVQAIPTQIYFDKEGKEVGRHIGFMEKSQIQLIFKNLGVL